MTAQSTADRQARAGKLIAKACALLEAGQLTKADALLVQAQRLGSRPDAGVQVLRLRAAWQQGQAKVLHEVLGGLLPGEVSPEILALWQARLASLEGALALACAELERALVLAPSHPEILREYARVLAASGAHAPAAERWLCIHRSADGELSDAIAAVETFHLAGDLPSMESLLASLNPDQAQDWRLLRLQALLLCDQGKAKEAVAPIEAALQLAPVESAVWWVLAEMYLRTNRPSEARTWYLRLLKRFPKDANLLSNLASTHSEEQELKQARHYFHQAYQLTQEPLFLLRSALLLPAIPQNIEAISAARAAFLPGLQALQRQGLQLPHPLETVGVVPFYLAYHGELNRDLHQGLAEFYRAVAPSLAYTAPHTQNYAGPRQRIRVGLISTFFRNHSIGKTSRGFVDRLDRARFEVIVIFVGSLSDDELARAMYEGADQAVVLPARMDALRPAIAALELDVLFYQDIGMEPVTYFLAHARLAPVQCYSFGHPDTTGLPTMDWFISCELFEPPDADPHYTERLWRIPGAGTLAYYYQPERAEALHREDIGVPDDAHFYLCAQTLFKFHPEFDGYLLGILEADPKAIIGLVKSPNPEWPRRLSARLETRMPAARERLRWLEGVSTAKFHSLVATADVMLDTLHFNGMNTSLEAFAQGKAVITQPAAFQRGRHTAGMYRAMGMQDQIALSQEDYIRRAVALGTSAAARAEVELRLREQAGVLFENDAIIRGFEACFEMAVEAAISRV